MEHLADSTGREDVLYKYVTAERALTCIPQIGDGTLRATQPAALNDPFECAVTVAYGFAHESDEDLELSSVLTETNESKPITEKSVRHARQKYGSMFRRELLTEQLSTRFGIVSFTTRPHHPLMWSHYTTDGSGFVIGYRAKELKKLVGQKGCLQQVIYTHKPPPFLGPFVHDSPDFSFEKLLSYKSSHWAYENEWRLILELNGTVGTGVNDQFGQPINLVRVPNEAVISVFYTERTPKETVMLISGRLADKNNRYQVEKPQKLVLSFDSYGYEVEGEDYL